MTEPAASFTRLLAMSDDELVERAVLDMLAETPELYPSAIAGRLRRDHPHLAADRLRPVLERLFAERRVARLWHRYMLPGAVAEVRARWIAMIDRQAGRLRADLDDPHACGRARALLRGWDGWTMG